MNCWEILGLTPSTDKRVIKRHYAERLKQNRPEDDPTAFQQLQTAYKTALTLAETLELADQQADKATTENLLQPITPVIFNDTPCADLSITCAENETVVIPAEQLAPSLDWFEPSTQTNSVMAEFDHQVEQLFHQLMEQYSERPEDSNRYLRQACAAIGEFALSQRSALLDRILDYLSVNTAPYLTLSIYHYFYINENNRSANWSIVLNEIEFYESLVDILSPLFRQSSVNATELAQILSQMDLYSLPNHLLLWLDFYLIELIRQRPLTYPVLYTFAQLSQLAQQHPHASQLYTLWEDDHLNWRITELPKLDFEYGTKLQARLLEIYQHNNFIGQSLNLLLQTKFTQVNLRSRLEQQIKTIDQQIELIRPILRLHYPSFPRSWYRLPECTTFILAQQQLLDQFYTPDQQQRLQASRLSRLSNLLMIVSVSLIVTGLVIKYIGDCGYSLQCI